MCHVFSSVIFSEMALHVPWSIAASLFTTSFQSALSSFGALISVFVLPAKTFKLRRRDWRPKILLRRAAPGAKVKQMPVYRCPVSNGAAWGAALFLPRSWRLGDYKVTMLGVSSLGPPAIKVAPRDSERGAENNFGARKKLALTPLALSSP